MLDEVSLFMKNRDDASGPTTKRPLSSCRTGWPRYTTYRLDDLRRQQAIESKVGVRNIIADDRLKLVPLLQNDQDYYDIVLNRVREIIDRKPLPVTTLITSSGSSGPPQWASRISSAFYLSTSRRWRSCAPLPTS